MLSVMRRERGFTLFEALVASLLLGMLGLGVLSFVESLELERRQAAAARDLGTLARAARAHAGQDIGAMRAATGPLGMRELAMSELTGSGWLHRGFPRRQRPSDKATGSFTAAPEATASKSWSAR